jgi:hypothetical protein
LWKLPQLGGGTCCEGVGLDTDCLGSAHHGAECITVGGGGS